MPLRQKKAVLYGGDCIKLTVGSSDLIELFLEMNLFKIKSESHLRACI